MARSARNRRRVWITSGGAAFFLALVAAVIGWGGAILGPQLEVENPTGIFFYREGSEGAAVVAVLRIEVSNSSEYNDFVRDASLRFRGLDARFANSGRVLLRFTGESDSQAICPPHTPCIPHTGLAVIDAGDAPIEVSARGSASHFYSFRLICRDGGDCPRFGNLAATTAALSGNGLEVEVVIRFREDGERMLKCRTRPLNGGYIRDHGWQGLQCVQASVEGSSRLSLF